MPDRDAAQLPALQIRALWQAATIDGLSDTDYLQAVVDLGTANLRPEQPLFGYISALSADGARIDVASAGGTAIAPGELLARGAPPEAVGGRLERRLLADGRTTTRGSDGPGSWAWVIGAPVRSGGQTRFLIFAAAEPPDPPTFSEEDVAFTDVLAAQIMHHAHQGDQLARLRYQMEHDGLTDLPNRMQFRTVARRELAHGSPAAIALVDLDRFRDINAALGSNAADEILVEVALALRSVAAGDFVARMHGDQFAVLMPGIAEEATLCARLDAYQRIFDTPFHSGDLTDTRFTHVTCSIGAALFPRDQQDYDGVTQCADVALEAAKRRGGASVVAFSDPLQERARIRRSQRQAILEGLTVDSFVLEYQPTFELATGALVGAEALIRWNDPERGRVMPGAFIDIAERDGLIAHISRWVVKQIVEDLRSVVLPPNFRCYMNFPAHLFDDAAFLSELDARLGDAHDLCTHLGIEITESEAMQNFGRTSAALHAVRRRGLRVAVDDFGTGYSSLVYLKRLPIDLVKLDREFVAGLPDDAKDVSVTELFVGLTERLGIVSLAEGIETERQAAWLAERGCKLGQGYLFSHPLPLEALRTLLLDPPAARRSLENA